MCKYCTAIRREHFETLSVGDLRVWWIPQIPMESFYYPVKSLREAKLLLNALAQYDLFQLHHNVKPDYSNAGGLHVWEDDGSGNFDWNEWYDDFGNCIDEVEFLE